MPFGIPILVLGDSHYDKRERPFYRTWTRETIEEWRRGDYHYNIYVRIAGVFGGEWPTQERRDEVYNSIIFYNYVQESAGTGAGQSPTNEMYQNAASAFGEILKLCKPGLVLVLGNRLWNAISKEITPPMKRGPAIALADGRIRPSLLYERNDGATLLFGIHHPSCRGGWPYEAWTPWVQAACKKAVEVT